jgi:hypothetical protein
MFNRKDRVVRKDVTLGVRQGTVIQQAGNRVEVQWDNGRKTRLNADLILLATPENVTKVNMKRM